MTARDVCSPPEDFTLFIALLIDCATVVHGMSRWHGCMVCECRWYDCMGYCDGMIRWHDCNAF